MSAPGSIPGLERIERLLELMGHPEKSLKYVHIAGTNGKGTTSLIISEVLTRAGYKVGRFISPHIHYYRERFTVDGVEIKAELLDYYLYQTESKIKIMVEEDESRPTEFEILTAIAFQYFKDCAVDFAVLEVGMGGIYDSTNVIIPEVSVITGVDYDHTSYLGNTLEEIAANKAGIIKTGVPVVVGPMDERAFKVMQNKAQIEQAELYNSSLVRVIRRKNPGLWGQEVDIDFFGCKLTGIQFSLLGDYQLVNLSTALTALKILEKMGYEITEDNIKTALPDLRMPGRMEVINHKPLIILDVAHNPQAARGLAASLESLLPGVKKVLIFGLLDDKDAIDTLQPLGEYTRLCIVTRPISERGEKWRRVKNYWEMLFPDIEIYEEESISAAIKKAMHLLRDNEYLIITGSFYVLDEARRYLTIV